MTVKNLEKSNQIINEKFSWLVIAKNEKSQHVE